MTQPYGVNESGLTGLEGKLRIYIGKDDFVYFLSSMLGLVGIVLEGICVKIMKIDI